MESTVVLYPIATFDLAVDVHKRGVVGPNPTPLGDLLARLVLLGLAVEKKRNRFSHRGHVFILDRRC